MKKREPSPDWLRLLAQAATPGPWEHHRTHEPPGGGEPEVCAPGHDYVCSPSCDADGNYIAALDPPTVLALLDRIATLEAALRRVSGMAQDVSGEAARAALAQPVGGAASTHWCGACHGGRHGDCSGWCFCPCDEGQHPERVPVQPVGGKT